MSIVFECESCGEIFRAEPERSICGDLFICCETCVRDHENECHDCTAQTIGALD